jgi:RNA ligase (TIGR02306 family)
MRKLVSIKQIDSIQPIDGADAIEAAMIGGWAVVVKKGDFKPADHVLYFEIDSILPKGYPEFEFLMARSSGTYSTDEGDTLEGHRLRTIKLRGQVSQGLIIPLPTNLMVSDCGTSVLDDNTLDVRDIDADFSDLFGVKKYEKRLSANLSGVARGNFPSFIPKTDQERIQNLSKHFPKWVADETIYEMTEKLDGTSCTVYKNSHLLDEGKDALGVCSRNLDLKDTEGNVYWDAVRRYDIHAILLRDGRNLAIQGEIIGEGIQGNQYRLTDRQFFVFDIYDIDSKEYFDGYERQEFCKINNLQHVPVINSRYMFEVTSAVDAIPMADGPSALNGTPREGLVFKSLRNPTDSFKIISNKWLMKYDE